MEETNAEMEGNVAYICQQVARDRQAERDSFGRTEDCNSKRRTPRAECLTEALITGEQACATNEVVARRRQMEAYNETISSRKFDSVRLIDWARVGATHSMEQMDTFINTMERKGLMEHFLDSLGSLEWELKEARTNIEIRRHIRDWDLRYVQEIEYDDAGRGFYRQRYSVSSFFI